jgi:hypothetical protein
VPRVIDEVVLRLLVGRRLIAFWVGGQLRCVALRSTVSELDAPIKFSVASRVRSRAFAASLLSSSLRLGEEVRRKHLSVRSSMSVMRWVAHVSRGGEMSGDRTMMVAQSHTQNPEKRADARRVLLPRRRSPKGFLEGICLFFDLAKTAIRLNPSRERWDADAQSLRQAD